MRYSLEKLVRGEDEIIEYYRKAADYWKVIWSRRETDDPYLFASLLGDEQLWFVANCGGRRVGSEVMVVSGLVGQYTTASGFDEENLRRARRLYDAFMLSACGVEVKSLAEEVARFYDLVGTGRF